MKIIYKKLFLSLIILLNLNSFTDNTKFPKSIVSKKIDIPPLIDGKLNDECWKNIVPATDFISIGMRDFPEIYPDLIVEEQTKVFCLYDENNIYFGIWAKCLKDILYLNVKRDNLTFKGDSIEIFITPNFIDYYLLMVNPLNIQLDAKGKIYEILDIKWDAEWKSATKIDEGEWTCEISIPLKVFEIKEIKNNETWRINFIRNHSTYHVSSIWSNPVKPNLSPLNPDYLGYLIFNDNKSILQIKKILFPFKNYIGENSFFLSLENLSNNSKKIKYDVKIDNKSTLKKEINLNPIEEKEICISFNIDEKEAKNLSFIITEENTEINFVLKIEKPLKTFLERNMYFKSEEFIKCKHAVSLSSNLLSDCKLKTLIKDKSEKILKKFFIESIKSENFKFDIDISDFRVGEYKIESFLYLKNKLIDYDNVKFNIEGGPFE